MVMLGRPHRSRAILLVCASTMSVGLLVGCGRAESDLTPYQRLWGSRLDPLIVEAEHSHASDEQVRLLRAARDELDGIGYADYEAAVRLSIACIQKAGYLIDGPQTHRRWGLTTLEYGYGTPKTNLTEAEDKAMNDAVAACQQKYSTFVESAYEGQPSMLQQQDAVIRQFTPVIVACIRRNGVELPDHPTDEQRTDALRQVLEQKPNEGGPDCMEESGMGPALRAGEDQG